MYGHRLPPEVVTDIACYIGKDGVNGFVIAMGARPCLDANPFVMRLYVLSWAIQSEVCTGFIIITIFIYYVLLMSYYVLFLFFALFIYCKTLPAALEYIIHNKHNMYCLVFMYLFSYLFIHSFIYLFMYLLSIMY